MMTRPIASLRNVATLRATLWWLLFWIAVRVVALSDPRATPSSVAAANLPGIEQLAQNASNSTNDIDDYHVPGTIIHLNMVLRPPYLDRTLLGRALLLTNITLFDYISQHRAYDKPVIPLDDPYSSDVSPSLYIEMRSQPYHNPHLTYGVIAQVLQGLWLYLYMGRRSMTTGIDVYVEGVGLVGLGAVLSYDPRSVSYNETPVNDGLTTLEPTVTEPSDQPY